MRALLESVLHSNYFANIYLTNQNRLDEAKDCIGMLGIYIAYQLSAYEGRHREAFELLQQVHLKMHKLNSQHGRYEAKDRTHDKRQ